MPRETSRLASTTSESRVCWTWPGMDAMGIGSSIPSRTNSGATRSSTPRPRLGDQAAERRGAAQAAQPAGREVARGGNVAGVASAMALQPTGGATPGPEVVDQLGDDAVGRRAPGLVHAHQARRPGGRGRRRADADHVPGHGRSRAGGSAQRQVGLDREEAVSVSASATATRASRAGSGAGSGTVR